MATNCRRSRKRSNSTEAWWQKKSKNKTKTKKNQSRVMGKDAILFYFIFWGGSASSDLPMSSSQRVKIQLSPLKSHLKADTLKWFTLCFHADGLVLVVVHQLNGWRQARCVNLQFKHKTSKLKWVLLKVAENRPFQGKRVVVITFGSQMKIVCFIILFLSKYY